jgi:hypothetical protein
MSIVKHPSLSIKNPFGYYCYKDTNDYVAKCDLFPHERFVASSRYKALKQVRDFVYGLVSSVTCSVEVHKDDQIITGSITFNDVGRAESITPSLMDKNGVLIRGEFKRTSEFWIE